VTSQGSAYGRFRRALDGGNPMIALAEARELDFIGLVVALELVLLLVDEPRRSAEALRWHARYCREVVRSRAMTQRMTTLRDGESLGPDSSSTNVETRARPRRNVSPSAA
jgi:hypothetical protein